MADGYLNFDTKINEQGFNTGISKLGSLASKGMAVVGAASAAGIAAFGKITKASLDSVASMEQNVGGVETLFKGSADTVIANAKKAYETAGMSANDYMSTVTSFSASLLQSLGGDTVKAAKYADTAIIDMSDNANKMGTNIQDIQNAYQGFAKQNYTMLDNLKLGYGGTKTEMERLLKDAEAIKAKNGEVVDYSIDKFGDIVEAIHVVQSEMGVTGTTAAEAAGTIEGSMNAAKAAWDNFLNGSISAEEFAGTVAIAAANIIKNLGEIIPRLVSTIPAALSGIITAIKGQSETLLSAGAQIISAIAQGVAIGLPNLLVCAGQIVQYMAGAVAQNLPSISTAGAGAIAEFVTGILSKLPDVIASAGELLVSFVGDILNNLPTVLAAGVDLVLSLVDGIIDNLPKIVASAVTVVAKLLSTILSNAPQLISGGIALIGKLAAGLIQAAPSLIGKIPSIISQVKSAFTSVNWGSVGINIIKGIASGVTSAAGSLVDAAVNAATNALEWVKSKLGIHSPSRVFRDEVGKMMALGMGVGFEQNIPVKSMSKGVQTAVDSLRNKAIVATSAKSQTSVDRFTRHPDPNSGGGIDWNEWERRQRKINKERDSRPIFLGTKRIDYPLPKGAVPQV